MSEERPILFSSPMVRAILDGSKTQTRRIVKWQPSDGWFFDGRFGIVTSPHPKRGKFGAFIRKEADKGFPQADLVPCPYGQPGDRLWVRETWNTSNQWANIKPSEIPYGVPVYYAADYAEPSVAKPWRPSIHMPRWASRITLEILSVRLERLQDISGEDAIAEGGPDTRPSDPLWDCVSLQWFRNLWESINGEGSWGHNPRVWVVEFKKIVGGAQ